MFHEAETSGGDEERFAIKERESPEIGEKRTKGEEDICFFELSATSYFNFMRRRK